MGGYAPRAVVIATALIGLTGFGSACSGGSADPTCTHPCDLQQTLRVSLVGAPSATITGSGACQGSGTYTQPGICTSINIYLGSGAASHSPGPDMICHVTAVSPSGERVEQDVSAHYNGTFCCPGYELPVFVTLTFAGGDGSAPDGAPGDAAAEGS